MAKEVGIKFDSHKARYDLIPWEALDQLALCLTYGAVVHGDNNWERVEGGRDRYFSALCRHLSKIKQGHVIDAESGLHHLAHVITNAAFLIRLSQSSMTDRYILTEAAQKKVEEAKKIKDGTHVPTYVKLMDKPECVATPLLGEFEESSD